MEHKYMSMKEVCERLGLTRYYVLQLVTRFEKLTLVQHSPHGKIWFLTDEVERLAYKNLTASEKEKHYLHSEISKQEAKELAELKEWEG